MKGLAISSCTVMSGVARALVIIHGSALAPQVQILSYMMTGVVAFLMCIQARRTLLSFVPAPLSAPARPSRQTATGVW